MIAAALDILDAGTFARAFVWPWRMWAERRHVERLRCEVANLTVELRG